MRAESTGEAERRRPRFGRIMMATVLLVLAVVVLGAAVRYSTRTSASAVDSPATVAPDTAEPGVPAYLTDPATTVSSSGVPASAAGSAPALNPATPPAATPATTAAAVKTPTAKATTAAVKVTPKPFTAITVQAEGTGGTLSGGAAEVDCGTCSGGARVRFVGRVDISATVPESGTRKITFVYEIDGTRSFNITINGGYPIATRTVTGTAWTTPQSLTITTSIPAGPVRIGYYGEAGNAPDLDAVTIS